MKVEKRVIKIGKDSLGIILDKSITNGNRIKQGDLIIIDIKLKKKKDG